VDCIFEIDYITKDDEISRIVVVVVRF